MSILHTPPAQPTDDDVFGVVGPVKVKVLDGPTKAGLRLRASLPSSPDQPGIEIAPRGEVLQLVPVMGATNAHVMDQPTEGGGKQNKHLIDGRKDGQPIDGSMEDRPRSGELVISESMGDTTPNSMTNSHWPAGTPACGFGNIGFQAGRLKSVRFAGQQESEEDSELEDGLVPLNVRRVWARQVSTTNFSISQGHLSYSRSLGASALPTHTLGEPEDDYTIFPKYIPLKDRLEINKHVGEFWYIIDAMWISQWITFVLADGEPPGVISNYNLFERESSPDRLETLLWYILREMYGTDDAPELCRWTHDVYTPEVTAQRKLRLEENSKPSAVHELRRFLTKVRDYAQELKEEETPEAEA